MHRSPAQRTRECVSEVRNVAFPAGNVKYQRLGGSTQCHPPRPTVPIVGKAYIDCVHREVNRFAHQRLHNIDPVASDRHVVGVRVRNTT